MKKIIYFFMIISFLFILIVDRHFAIPFVMAEFFAVKTLLSYEYDQISEFIPFFLIILGQMFFLVFGIQKVNKMKLILLLSSPILINLGLLLFLDELIKAHKISTIKTMIPFWICSLFFYIQYFRELKIITWLKMDKKN